MTDIAAGDPARMEIAGWFYRAIEDHLRAYVAIAVEVEPLRRVVTELGFRDSMEDPGYLDNPYILAFRALFDFTAQYQHELGIAGPIDFIFDKRGEKKKVLEGFEVFKKHCREDIRGRLGTEPRFEDDEDYLPLQAADLLAWHIRKFWLRHRSITTGPLELSWKPNRDIRGYCFNMDYNDIKTNLSTLKQKLIDAGYVFRRPVSIKVSFSCDLSSPNRD